MAQVSRRTKWLRAFLVLLLASLTTVGLALMYSTKSTCAPGMICSSGKDANGLYALVISTITSAASVIGLLMSKYTEWQRARLKQMKLAIELQQKELELQEMRRKMQNV